MTGRVTHVDWATRDVLRVVGFDDAFLVFPLRRTGGSWFSGERGVLLGRGLAAACREGLTLATRRWKRSLLATRADTRPSLSSDGRELRVELAGRPCRFLLDGRTGEVLGTPPDLERLAREHDRPGGAVWHPHAGVAFVRRRGGVFELRAVDRDERLLEFPRDVQPWCWSLDGHALVVLRSRSGPRVAIEVWRARGGA